MITCKTANENHKNRHVFLIENIQRKMHFLEPLHILHHVLNNLSLKKPSPSSREFLGTTLKFSIGRNLYNPGPSSACDGLGAFFSRTLLFFQEEVSWRGGLKYISTVHPKLLHLPNRSLRALSDIGIVE